MWRAPGSARACTVGVMTPVISPSAIRQLGELA
jgi:hypothetical protein